MIPIHMKGFSGFSRREERRSAAEGDGRTGLQAGLNRESEPPVHPARPGGATQLRSVMAESRRLHPWGRVQGWVNSSPRIAVTGAPVVQGRFVGEPGRHHLHVEDDVAQPHYKNGNDRSSRINLGTYQDYRKDALEEVIDLLRPRATEPGAAECITWCRAESRRIIREAGGRGALRRAG